MAGALLDREIRDRYPQLQEGDRKALDDRMAAGSEDRVLFALLRDPFQTRAALSARATLRARVETTSQDALSALDGEEELADWAESAASALTNVLSRSDAFGLGAGARAAA